MARRYGKYIPPQCANANPGARNDPLRNRSSLFAQCLPMWRLRSVDGPLGNWPGNRRHRESAEIPREAQDSPSGMRLVGAVARTNNLPIWRHNALVPRRLPSAPAVAISTLCAFPVHLMTACGQLRPARHPPAMSSATTQRQMEREPKRPKSEAREAVAAGIVGGQ